jgi:hypothetical protein
MVSRGGLRLYVPKKIITGILRLQGAESKGSNYFSAGRGVALFSA